MGRRYTGLVACSFVLLVTALYYHLSVFISSSTTNTQIIVLTAPQSPSIEDVFEDRRLTLSKGCYKHFGYDPKEFKRLNSKIPRNSPFNEFTFYDDKYKLLFCTIPKVASTNIKEMLIGLLDLHLYTTPPNWTGPPITLPHIHRLIELSDVAIKAKMNYTKILFVRHPLDRLISAWRNKFSQGIPAENIPRLSRFGKHITEKYRKDKTRVSAMQSFPLSLEEFLEFVTKEGATNPIMEDEHWRSYVKHCDPCRVEYNYIGHYENLQPELDYILKATTNRTLISKKPLLPGPAPDSFASNLKRILGNQTNFLPKAGPSLMQLIYASQLPKRLIDDVYGVYGPDFDIFGYQKNLE